MIIFVFVNCPRVKNQSSPLLIGHHGIMLRTKWEHVPEIGKPILHIKNRQTPPVEGFNVADQYEVVGTVRYAYKSEPGAYRFGMLLFLSKYR